VHEGSRTRAENAVPRPPPCWNRIRPGREVAPLADALAAVAWFPHRDPSVAAPVRRYDAGRVRALGRRLDGVRARFADPDEPWHPSGRWAAQQLNVPEP
jgi:hypothetical protein